MMDLLQSTVPGFEAQIKRLERDVIMEKPKTFEQTLPGMTMERLLELRGQHLGEFAEHPKAKALEERIKQIDAVIRSRPDAPKLVKVRALEWVQVDGQIFRQGQEGEITEQQYAALASHFEKVK
jgi:hypothetical protein